MNLSNILFVDRFPSLDLHGFDSQTAKMLINDFIKENYKLNNQIITIIHGVGTGILKKTTQDTLKTSKMVKEYSLYYNNNGCTIVALIDNTSKK